VNFDYVVLKNNGTEVPAPKEDKGAGVLTPSENV